MHGPVCVLLELAKQVAFISIFPLPSWSFVLLHRVHSLVGLKYFVLRYCSLVSLTPPPLMLACLCQAGGGGPVSSRAKNISGSRAAVISYVSLHTELAMWFLGTMYFLQMASCLLMVFQILMILRSCLSWVLIGFTLCCQCNILLLKILPSRARLVCAKSFWTECFLFFGIFSIWTCPIRWIYWDLTKYLPNPNHTAL